MAQWFSKLFGFEETSYDETRSRFEVQGQELRSRVNGRSFQIGRFSTPSLASLRQRAQSVPRGRITVTHEVIGDVLELHAEPANAGALFQVASQFNCLEFCDPRQVPEDGVTDYASDPTQGPACSLAAGAATVYRNYFAPVDGVAGQTTDRQLDNLDDLAAALGAPAEFFEVRGGYTWSDEVRLLNLAREVATRDRDALTGLVKIGLQEEVGVTFARRFVEPTNAAVVSQAFCSALSCGYNTIDNALWTPLATITLDAAYEATLLAAAVGAPQPSAPRRVWLTALGGGAFGNPKEWIGTAIGRAIARAADLPLDVRVAHHRRHDRELSDFIERAVAS